MHLCACENLYRETLYLWSLFVKSRLCYLIKFCLMGAVTCFMLGLSYWFMLHLTHDHIVMWNRFACVYNDLIR